MPISYYPLQDIISQYEPQLVSTLADVARSGHYLKGGQVSRFEELWSHEVGVEHTLACANGLDALTLVLLAWRIRHNWADDAEVIVPSFTFAATGLAVLRAGMRPVWCDVGADALIDVREAESAITEKTRAIIGVDLYGRVCDIGGLRLLKARYGVKLLEDAAQAHFAAYRGRRAGSLMDAAAFSFYPGKNLGALGDAGCVCTDDEDVMTLCRALADYGAAEKYDHRYVGINSRMDELQAAVLLARIPHLESENQHRRGLAAHYRELLRNLPVETLAAAPPHSLEVHHIFPVFVPAPRAFRSKLLAHGIETACHYPQPLHLQPAFASLKRRALPQSEQLAHTEVSLPIHPLLKASDVAYICKCIKDITA